MSISLFTAVQHVRWSRIGMLIALLFGVTATTASAETLMMPKRDMLRGTSQVVWGVTTLPNNTTASPTTYAIDFGDGTPVATGTVADRSYIAVNHTYEAAGTFIATLQVTNAGTTESGTVEVRVFDGSVITAAQLRGVRTNSAIEDGLRYLWVNQTSRAANFPSGVMTSWTAAYPQSYTALVVLAFENHNYQLDNSDAAPTGLYEKYVVRRGLNYVIDQLRTITLTVQPAGTPCVNVEAAPCVGLRQNAQAEGYATSIAILPIAASNALNRRVTEIGGSQNAKYVVGRTYGEILQRLVNAMAFGQGDTGNARGGWSYSFNAGNIDGSTIGWNMMALLDAAAAGITIPAFVKTQFANFAIPISLGNDGIFDYGGDNNPNSTGARNMAKAGVAQQAMFFSDMIGLGDPRVLAGRNSINARWNAQFFSGDSFACATSQNKGCGYGMFNVFKGLKLQGITTLPNVARPAGPGAIPANDWYADYVDWLLTNQNTPTTPTGGHWPTMDFSCCDGGSVLDRAISTAALAELILSNVALISPDPTLFSTVGLAPPTALLAPGGTHTVTATATSAGGAAVAGVTIDFRVLSGPNANAAGQAVTDAFGHAQFTYTDEGGAGRDTIQAFIGQLGSNLVEAIWQVPTCDPTPLSVSLSAPLFPLDQGMRGLTINGAPGATVTQICQDEAPNFENVAAWAVDAAGVGTSAASIRAQRSGTRTAPGNGRVYHVYFTSSSCTGSVTLGVPAVAGGTAVDNGPLYNSVTGGSCAVPTTPAVVAAPNLVGDTQAGMAAKLLAAGLNAGLVSHLNHPSIPAGQVMSQSPGAGTNVAVGSAIAMTISTGPSSVAIPQVVGSPQGTAMGSISGAGLGVNVVEVHDLTVPAGLVMAQSPIAGTHVAPGSSVELTVSLGRAVATVPNLISLPLTGAVNTVNGAGLNFGEVELVSHATIPDGEVISQSPPAGTVVAPASNVNFIISTGPPPVPVPSVLGQTQAAAEATLIGASLTLGTVGLANDPVVPAGLVIFQGPAAGLTARPGSPINITLSNGPVMVPVPNVVGAPQVPAQTTVTSAGLAVGALTLVFDNAVAPGSVVGQLPAGGATAPLGSAVALTISKGPAPVTVPNLVGQSETAATAVLGTGPLGLGTISRTNSATVPQGTVMGQGPLAGTPVPAGTLVNLLVSLGPVMIVVPDVVGAPQQAAMNTVLGAKLSVSVNFAASTTVPAGSVISQSPSAGSSVAQGSFVNLIASSGPTIGVVPNVVGQPEAAAAAAITGASLTVGSIMRVNSPTVPAGQVLSQNPPPGSGVPVNSPVSFAVSLGPIMVTVPSVVGDTDTVATQKVFAANLGYHLTYRADLVVPAHGVISQDPAGGQSVAQGTMVTIVASSGPTNAVVPNVVGQQRTAAESAITTAGLSLGTVTQASHATVPDGAVISQTPAGGANAPPGALVSLVVSIGPPVPTAVPNVVGQERAEAEQALVTAGFLVGTVAELNDPAVPLGVILSQTPAGGGTALRGSTVDLVVSLGTFIPGVPHSLELVLSSVVVGSGSPATITTTVKDGFETPIVPMPGITYQVIAQPGATGDAPTVSGNQLLTSADTRGGYIVRAAIDGTAVEKEVGFVVINGSVEATNAAKFVKLGAAQTVIAGSIGNLLAAYQSIGTAADVTAARTALASTLTTIPITGRRAMQRSTAVAPEVGFLPTLGQVQAAGYPQTPHDAAFGTVINQLNAKLGQITSFYNALNPDGTAGGTNSVEQLTTLNNELAALQAQLVALNVTPHGIVRYAPQLNRLLTRTIPVYLHAVGNRAISIAQQYPDPPSVAPSVARMPGTLKFFANLERMKPVTPGTFYGQTQPAFFGLGGMLGGMSIQMNLVVQIYGPIFNEVAHILGVLVADGIIQSQMQTVGIDIVSGASLSFHAPGMGGSHIESFVADPTNIGGNETWFLGPEAFKAAQDLIESFDPSDIENLEDLWDFFNGIADAVSGAADAYDNAHTQGDSLIPNGCILNDGGGCVATVFNSGFPDVNTTRFPSPVIVMIENLTTGNWGYGIFNFVP